MSGLFGSPGLILAELAPRKRLMRLIITELPSRTADKLGYRVGGRPANYREVIRVMLSGNGAVSLQLFLSYTR